MKQLLAYLFVRRSDGNWDVASYRELEGLVVAWSSVSDPEASAVVHVGFWRPDTAAFEEAAMENPGIVLVTEAARGALPTSFRSSSSPCASAGGLHLFEALSGWGYERGDVVHPAAIPVDAQGESTNRDVAGRSSPAPRSQWLSLTRIREPALWGAAEAAGMFDDTTYMARESAVPYPERDELAHFRFSCLAGGVPTEINILDSLVYGPPWLLDLDVKALDLSTRPTNRLNEEKVRCVADIAKFGEDGLLKIPNMGRRSVAEIAKKIFDAFRRGSVFCTTHKCKSALIMLTGLEHCSWSDKREKTASHSEIQPSGPATFAEALDEAFELLKERESRILKLRMGFDGTSKTLESVGEVFSLTRERIRQIESKASKRIAGQMTVWDDQMETGLERMLLGREEPLPLVALEVFNPWFRGADDMPEVFAFALEHFSQTQTYWLLKVDSQIYVSKINQEEWLDVLRAAKKLLDGFVKGDKSIPEKDARWMTESLLVGRGEELRPLLWKQATRWANFSTSQSGERLLASLGMGAENVMEAVLLESDRPLHYEEIAKLCLARGKSVDAQRAYNAAANIGILLAPGTYGLEQHIQLSDDERANIISETEDMLSDNTAKQWHVAEIFEGLEERGFDFGGRVSKYVVNFVLKGSKSLVYLGRMVWAAKSSSANGAANRIDIWQAVAAMLQENDGPMCTEEIRGRLSRDRGLGNTFMIVSGDPIIRIGAGVWGLLWRDIPFSEADAAGLVDEIEDVMRKMRKGLHTSEIVGSLPNHWTLASAVSDPVLLASLAQRTGRMKIGRGGYLYPTDWEGSRRLCAAEAVVAALLETDSKGATLTVLARRAGELVGRDVHTSLARRLLISAGAVYDADATMWSKPETNDPDTFDDADDASRAASDSGSVFPPSSEREMSWEPAPQGV
jgi:hypothetical protein